MKTFPYKNLVFKGGGVKGIAYVGALKALEDANIMAQISGFAGTSAGSIVAALAACKIKSDALNKFLSTTNYNKFKDKGGIFNFLNDLANHFGAYKGDYFLDDWFKVFMKQQGVNPDITFKGVNDTYGNTLKVFATDLNIQLIQVFSTETTPNVKIAEAVRASMSIPLFFRAWKFPDGNPSSHIFVDGGVMYNYPIDTFDSQDSPDQTLGFFLTDPNPGDSKANDLDFGISHLELYIKSLFESLMDSQNILVQDSKFEEERTIQVDDLGISATDFDITKAQAQALYNSGFNATQKFLGAIA